MYRRLGARRHPQLVRGPRGEAAPRHAPAPASPHLSEQVCKPGYQSTAVQKMFHSKGVQNLLSEYRCTEVVIKVQLYRNGYQSTGVHN